jgi:hypothetical protein
MKIVREIVHVKETPGLVKVENRRSHANSLWRRAMMGRLNHDQQQLFYSRFVVGSF